MAGKLPLRSSHNMKKSAGGAVPLEQLDARLAARPTCGILESLGPRHDRRTN